MHVLFLEKTPTKGIKRKASSNARMSGKKEDSMNLSIINSSNKSKSLVPSFTEQPVHISY